MGGADADGDRAFFELGPKCLEPSMVPRPKELFVIRGRTLSRSLHIESLKQRRLVPTSIGFEEGAGLFEERPIDEFIDEGDDLGKRDRLKSVELFFRGLEADVRDASFLREGLKLSIHRDARVASDLKLILLILLDARENERSPRPQTVQIFARNARDSGGNAFVAPHSMERAELGAIAKKNLIIDLGRIGITRKLAIDVAARSNLIERFGAVVFIKANTEMDGPEEI